jgi:hypothetical protein
MPGLTWKFREHDVVQFEIACVAEPALVATSFTDLTVDVAAVRISEFDFVEPITTVTFTEAGEDVVPGTGSDARFAPPPPPPHAASEIAARVIASVITTPFDFCLVGFTSTPLEIVPRAKMHQHQFARSNASLPNTKQSYNMILRFNRDAMRVLRAAPRENAMNIAFFRGIRCASKCAIALR